MKIYQKSACIQRVLKHLFLKDSPSTYFQIGFYFPEDFLNVNLYRWWLIITGVILHKGLSPVLFFHFNSSSLSWLWAGFFLFPFPPAMMLLFLLELLSWQFSQALFCLQKLYLFLFSVWTTTALRGMMWAVGQTLKAVNFSTGVTDIVLQCLK